MTDTTPPTEKETNPLLSRVHLPGQTYRLPSGGLFYTNGELSHEVEDGEVHVHPMAAYDEILLKTPDLLLSGKAIEQVFNRCIPQIKKPLDLFGRDVDFLLVCLQTVTYGENMRISYTHNCKDAKRHDYTINIAKFITDSKSIDPTKKSATFTKKLENGQTVQLHPARMKDVLKMMQQYNPSEVLTAEQEHEETINTIMSVISDVDGITNPEHIKEWIATISAKWAKDLSDAIEDTGNFGPDLTHTLKCRDCKEEIKLSAPINPLSFFS